MTNRRRILFVILFILLTGLITFWVLHRGGQKPNTVRITNLGSCTKKINPAVRDSVEGETYSLVKSANDYNKTGTQPKYKATIREDSCKQEEEHSTKTYEGKKQTVKTSSFTLDIPEAKQSWKLTFDWITGNGKINIDLGSIRPECIANNSLVYGQFNCEKIMSIAKYGTDKYDPILQYVPYTGQGFDIFYDPDTKTVKAQIRVSPKNLNNTELIENSKYSVTYWFQHRNLNPKNYTIQYEIVPLDR